MPQFILDKKIEFNVDQLAIDRVEALAVIEGLSLDAWLRRKVDAFIRLGFRHMRSDHIDIKEIRQPVLEIIEKMAMSLTCPLRDKAEIALSKLLLR